MDEDIRSLERAAALGDERAKVRLARALIQRGQALPPELTFNGPRQLTRQRSLVEWDAGVAAWVPPARGKYHAKLAYEVEGPVKVELILWALPKMPEVREFPREGQKVEVEARETRAFRDSDSTTDELSILGWVDPIPTALRMFVTGGVNGSKLVRATLRVLPAGV